MENKIFYSVFEIKIDIVKNEYEMRVVKDYKDVGLFDNIQQAKNLLNSEINMWVEILNEDVDNYTYFSKKDDTIIYNKQGSEIVRKYFIKEFKIKE